MSNKINENIFKFINLLYLKLIISLNSSKHNIVLRDTKLFHIPHRAYMSKEDTTYFKGIIMEQTARQPSFPSLRFQRNVRWGSWALCTGGKHNNINVSFCDWDFNVRYLIRCCYIWSVFLSVSSERPLLCSCKFEISNKTWKKSI